MPPIHDQALCLRIWEWSETSQTLAALTREHGLVRALAKGSRRPKAPFSGGLELLTRGDLGLILKSGGGEGGVGASRSGGDDLAMATSWDLLETFPALRTRLDAHHAGMFVADALLHAVTDHDPHPGLFDAAVFTLRDLGGLNAEASTSPALASFLWALLVQTGYRPQLRGVEDPDPGTAFAFDPEEGTLLPDHDGVAGAGTNTWPVRSGTARVLGALESGHSIDDVPGESVDRCARLLAAYLRHLIGREPPTMPLVFGRIPWGARHGKPG